MTHDPDGLDREVRDALAVALNEKKLRIATRWNDRRMLILYVVGVVIVSLMLSGYHGLATACDDNRQNAMVLNAALDKMSESAATSPVLTPSERRERAAFYAGLRQSVPSCPPGLW